MLRTLQLGRILSAVVLLLALEAIAAPGGVFDNASLLWLEGWACDPALPASTLTVEAFVTATGGDGVCIPFAGTTICRVGTGPASFRREAGVGAACGGIATRGFRIPTSLPQLRDAVSHSVFAFANVGGIRTQLASSPRVFNSTTLYAQESFVNIDDHLMVGHSFIDPAAQQNYDFNFHGHTLLIQYLSPAPSVNPLSDVIGNVTGVFPGSPVSSFQRSLGVTNGVATGGCYTENSSHECNATQAWFDRVGVLLNARAMGVQIAGAFLQTIWRNQPAVAGPGTGWEDFPRPWRASGVNDILRVEARVTQPQVFPDPTNTGSPDDVSFWYLVLYLKDRLTNRGIWLSALAHQSRSSGFSKPNDPLNHPFTERAWVNVTENAGYLQAPIARGGQFLTPCDGSATYSTQPPATEQRFCFDINTQQMANMLWLLELEALPPMTFSTDPAAYDLQFFLLNAEAWAPGTAQGTGGIPPTKLGFSVRNMKVQSLKDTGTNYNPWGYLEKSPTLLSGWVCDRDDYSRPIDVHFYATNATGSNCSLINNELACYVGEVTANREREPAVANNCMGSPFHGFQWNLPAQLLTGPHKIYAKAINYPAGANLDLQLSPAVYP